MIEIIQGNLLKQPAEVLVNPINADIIYDKGIPFFIKKIGGDEIEKEAVKYFPAKLGDVFVTKAGALQAKYVIHIVNRQFSKRTSYVLLQKSMCRVFEKAADLNVKDMAIPPIYNRFSPEITARILTDALQESFSLYPKLKNIRIYIVIFDREAYQIFYHVFKNSFPDLVKDIQSQ
ncbi:MAG TPA: hypothetical protein DHW82_02010 [Spirochaetia bacterium]|nr:MAG: hypothetical protein A2Y41_07690 [Spirochaetes bacterium GWB1_36_13]HCL55771.1 hypothetical protein [Spirochaetia bacterium]